MRPFPPQLVENIEKFFESEGEREVGRDSYDEVFRVFHPLQRRRELEAMIRLGRSVSPRVVCELGTANGGGLYHWCKCIDTVKRVIACEMRGCPFKEAFTKGLPNLDFFWWEKSSHDIPTRQALGEWLGDDLIDVLFIDGDKKHFEKDFYDFLPLVNKAGIVFMHDIQTTGKSAFERITKKFQTVRLIDTTESAEAAHRKIMGDDADLESDYWTGIVPPGEGYTRWLWYWRGNSAGVGVIYPGHPK